MRAFCQAIPTMDYAIFASGGKQHKVKVGQHVKLEKLAAEDGAEISFDQVLLMKVGEQPAAFGKPYVEGAAVQATVLQQGKGPKIQIIHFKRRKHQLKRMGHRQRFTEVKITGLQAAG